VIKRLFRKDNIFSNF